MFDYLLVCYLVMCYSVVLLLLFNFASVSLQAYTPTFNRLLSY